VPFRAAHGLVGRLVQEAEVLGAALGAVPRARAAAIHPALPELLTALGDWEASVERRATVGGSSLASAREQIQELERGFAGPPGAGG
jgi:argininosuccinate lyase